jgi:hypothetical protein
MRSGTRFLTVAALVTAIAALTLGAANTKSVSSMSHADSQR